MEHKEGTTLRKLILLCLILVMLSSCGAPSPDQGDTGTDPNATPDQGDTGTEPNANPDKKRSETTNERTISTGLVSEPTDNTLTLTVPELGIEEATVPTATGIDEQQMENSTAIHLEGTGFPWEAEANVYIVGKRLGDRGSPSYRAFYDIEGLEGGDKVYVTDANGQEYPYDIFEVSEVAPTDLYVLDPTPGKNIVTLQTCTLPDCSRRVVARSELDYGSVPDLVEGTSTSRQYEGTDLEAAQRAAQRKAVESGAVLPQPDVSATPDVADLEAGAERAAVEYYRAAGSQDWEYTYDALDSETQAMFTREEWSQKNQEFADNGTTTYDIESVTLDETSQENLTEVSVRLTGEDGSSSIRTTYFVLEGGEWKHRFGQEEKDLFGSGVALEESVPSERERLVAERARSLDEYTRLLEDPATYSGTEVEAVGEVGTVDTSEAKSLGCLNLSTPFEDLRVVACTQDAVFVERLGQFSLGDYVRVQGVFEDSVDFDKSSIGGGRYPELEMLVTPMSIESVDEAMALDPEMGTFRQLTGSSEDIDSGQDGG